MLLRMGWMMGFGKAAFVFVYCGKLEFIGDCWCLFDGLDTRIKTQVSRHKNFICNLIS